MGIFPQIGMKRKNVANHHLVKADQEETSCITNPIWDFSKNEIFDLDLFWWWLFIAMKWWWLRLIRDFCPIFSNSSQLRICFFDINFPFKGYFWVHVPISLLKKKQKISNSHLSMTTINITLNNKKPNKIHLLTRVHFSKTPVAVAWCSSPAQAIHAVDASPERTHRRPERRRRRPKIRVLKPTGAQNESTKTGDPVETGKIAVNKKNNITKRNTGNRTKNKFHDYIYNITWKIYTKF